MLMAINIPRAIIAALVILLAMVISLALMANKVGGWKELRQPDFTGPDLSPTYGLAFLVIAIVTIVVLNPLSGGRSAPVVPILVILIGLLIGWLVVRRSR